MLVSERVSLTVVMPVYNEEEAITLAVQDVQRDVLDRIAGAELIVINDGSRDRTGALLDEAGARDHRIRVIHQQNRGHGGAVMRGLEEARGEYIFLIDSDRQIPLTDFPAAWAHMSGGCDAVVGVRRRRQDPALRLHLSRLIQSAITLLFDVRVLDANVPYKIVRRAIWQEARTCIPGDTLAPSLFLAIYTIKRGYRVVEVDVVHKERDTGEVSIRRLRLLRFCVRGFRQMLAFRRSLRHAQ